MTKFKIGDKVRVTSMIAQLPYGTVVTIENGPIGGGRGGNYHFREKHEVVLGDDLELIALKPKKSARITALESQVAELQAKVEALEKAEVKPTFAERFPNTARFMQESAEVDGILSNIKRKAKPSLLTTSYPSQSTSPNKSGYHTVSDSAQRVIIKTPNEQRADVIDRAKTFVSENAHYAETYYDASVTFVVNSEKRTVVALLRDYADIVGKAIAKCDPDDVFNADIGKAIALARALGVDVPVEFVKAVQPTEHVLGQRVHLTKASPNMRITTNRTRAYEKLVRLCFVKETYPNSRILDDTDAVYE